MKCSAQDRFRIGLFWAVAVLLVFFISAVLYRDAPGIFNASSFDLASAVIVVFACANFFWARLLFDGDPDPYCRHPVLMVVAYALAIPVCSYFSFVGVYVVCLLFGQGENEWLKMGMALPLGLLFFPVFGLLTLGAIVICSYCSCFYVKMLPERTAGASMGEMISEELCVLRSWVRRSWLLVAVVLSGIVVMVSYINLQEAGARDCYLQLAGALEEERWEDAYAMMAPRYRSSTLLEEFIEERIELPPLATNHSLSAFNGNAEIFAQKQNGWTSGRGYKFIRVDGHWFFTGESEYYLD